MSDSYAGLANPETAASDFSATRFQVQQMLARVQTATLVKVVKVTGGGTGPVGRVDVQVLVQQVDGRGQAHSRPSIANVPYLRLQGGRNAVIIDPAAGDIGICLFCNRDISQVKATKDEAPPGSYRRFDLSDALYLGGVLNGAPEQYVRFADDGIHIHPRGKIFLEGDVVHTGTITSNGVNIGSTHRHTGVRSGSDQSGPPAPV